MKPKMHSIMWERLAPPSPRRSLAPRRRRRRSEAAIFRGPSANKMVCVRGSPCLLRDRNLVETWCTQQRKREPSRLVSPGRKAINTSSIEKKRGVKYHETSKKVAQDQEIYFSKRESECYDGPFKFMTTSGNGAVRRSALGMGEKKMQKIPVRKWRASRGRINLLAVS